MSAQYLLNGRMSTQYLLSGHRMSTGRYFILRSRLNELVLTVDTSGRAAVARVIMARHVKSWPANQLWFEDHVSGTIRSKVTGYCLDTSGRVVTVAPYKGGSADQDLVLNEGTIAWRSNLNLVLDITRANLAEGAELCRYERNGQANQNWIIEYAPPQYVTIQSMSTSELLSAEGGSPGARLTLRKLQGAPHDHQLWYEDRFGILHSKVNNFAIDSAKAEVCLNVYDACSMYHQFLINGNTLINRHDHQLLLKLKLNNSGPTTVDSGHAKNQETERWLVKAAG